MSQVRRYRLPDFVDANIPLDDDTDPVGAHHVARGLLAELCACTGAGPRALSYLSTQHRRPCCGLVFTTVVTAIAAWHGEHQLTVTVITRSHHQPTDACVHSEDWTLLVDGDVLTMYRPGLPPPGHQLADTVWRHLHATRSSAISVVAEVPDGPGS